MRASAFSRDHLSNEQLLEEVKRLAQGERLATAHLIGALMEMDARRLYLGEGCSSLFTYCTQLLHLSEHSAYGRIEAARAARRFPIILELLHAGALNLTAVGLLASHLTPANHHEVLAAARHKSKREVEQLVASLRPRPAIPASVRKLPPLKPPVQLPPPSFQQRVEVDSLEPLTVHVSASPKPGTAVTPLAPERYKFQCTLSRETYDKLRHAQDLLRHVIPDGDPAMILDRALTALLVEVSRTKLAATDRARACHPSATGSRHIPAAVKRSVWKRDNGQCAFVGTVGRCTERGFLEFHHVHPYAAGGQATADNIELRCKAHNAYEAERFFGPQSPLVREERHLYGAN